MKTFILTLTAILLFTGAVCAAETNSWEYATIRWGGRDNTQVILPGGKVKFMGDEIRSFTKPEKADDRSFYMNVIMNKLADEGFEFAGMTSDEVVMKRAKVKK